jgi:hypothetical protein
LITREKHAVNALGKYDPHSRLKNRFGGSSKRGDHAPVLPERRLRHSLRRRLFHNHHVTANLASRTEIAHYVGTNRDTRGVGESLFDNSSDAGIKPCGPIIFQQTLCHQEFSAITRSGALILKDLGQSTALSTQLTLLDRIIYG